MSDNCETDTNCDLASGNITFINTGNWYVNATVNCLNMEEPVTDQTIWSRSEGIIYFA